MNKFKVTLFLFVLSFILFNCEQDILTREKKIQKLDKVKISSLDKEPYLAELFDKINFTSSATGRINGSGSTIDTDSILMVLQADSLSYSYTFKVENKTTNTSFTNLVLKRVVNGFNAFYLTYEFEGNFSSDLTNFTGKVTSYKLDGSEILTKHFKNGYPTNQVSSGGRVQCTQTISVDKVCLTQDGTSMTTGNQLTCLYGWETVITISYSGSCYSDSDGSSNNGGGLPSQYTSYTWSNGTFVPFSHWSDGSIPGGPGQPSQPTNPCTAPDGGSGLESGSDPNSCSDNIGIRVPTDAEILALLDWAGKSDGLPYMWWEDEEWLDANFSLAVDQDYNRLTQEEKDLVKIYPAEAYLISKNVTIATTETVTQFGRNGLNDKSDAFRHSYFQAINTRSVGANVTKLFSDAHESEVPTQLILEKEMDLFNNQVGIDYAVNTPPILSLNLLIMDALIRGELKYLFPTLPPPFDHLGNPIPGGDPLFNSTHGITSATCLIPTNQ